VEQFVPLVHTAPLLQPDPCVQSPPEEHPLWSVQVAPSEHPEASVFPFGSQNQADRLTVMPTPPQIAVVANRPSASIASSWRTRAAASADLNTLGTNPGQSLQGIQARWPNCPSVTSRRPSWFTTLTARQLKA